MTVLDANGPETATNWLAHLSIALFGASMGVFGFGLALHAGGFDQPALIAACVGAGFAMSFWTLSWPPGLSAVSILALAACTLRAAVAGQICLPE